MRKHALKLVNHVVQFIGIFCINKFSIYISTTLGNTNKYLKDMRKHALKPVNHTYPKKKKKNQSIMSYHLMAFLSIQLLNH